MPVVKVPLHSTRRCFPSVCVVHRSNTAGILPPLALHWPGAALSRQGLGATQDFHHGLLEAKKPVHLDDEAAVAKLGEPVGSERIGVAILGVDHEQLAPRRVLPPKP